MGRDEGDRADIHYLDVRGKVILDVGGDFGLSQMHFLKNGAKKVVTYSLERQRYWFKHSKIEL